MSNISQLKGINFLSLGIILITVFLLIILINQTKADASNSNTWYVDDDLTECPSAEFSSIQTAVSNPDVLSGDEIIVCPGNYNEEVIIDKILNIESSKGASMTVLDGTGFFGSGFLIQANEVTISGFAVQNFIEANGIYLDNVEGIYLEKNEIKNNLFGIKITNSNNIEIKENSIHDNKKTGIYVFETSPENSVNNAEVLKNEIYNNSSRGISVATNGNWKNSDWNIEDNKIFNNNYGIRLVNTGQSIIQDNEITESGSYGIFIRSMGEAQTSQIEIEKNIINASFKSGIYLTADSNSALENVNMKKNKIYNSEDGIWFAGNAENSQIKNNIFTRNKIYSNNRFGMVFFGKGVFLNEILRNEVENNSSVGIHLENGCSQNLFEKNRIYKNGAMGMQFLNNIENNNIISNYFKWNKGSGFYVKNSSGNLIMKNKSYENGFNGISLIGVSNNNIIEKNRTKKNEKFDLNYDGFGTGNTNANNRFYTSSPDDWWEE